MAKRSRRNEPVYTRTPVEVERGVCAGTLRRIAARGKRGFYAGRTAKVLDAYMRSHGGILSGADLDAHRTRMLREWRTAAAGY